jgi:hypothetical protein
LVYLDKEEPGNIKFK